MAVRQYLQSLNPYEGLAASIVTSAAMFWGDAAMITYSLTSSSATASRWTFEGFSGVQGTGFTSALPAASAGGWQNITTATAQGYGSISTVPVWARVLRTPSHSSSTLIVSLFVGP